MTGLDLWVGPSCDARALMFRKDPKQREGMGGMLPKLIVNIMTMILITQIQATILISMTNVYGMEVVVDLVLCRKCFFLLQLLLQWYDLEGTYIIVSDPFNQLLSVGINICMGDLCAIHKIKPALQKIRDFLPTE